MARVPSSNQSGGALGKAIVLVFLAVFTLGSAGMAVAFLGAGSAFSGSPLGGVPMFMAVVPVGFVVIGVLMFIKTAATPSNALGEPETSDVGPVDADARSLPDASAPPPAATLVCPGCGSRKNVPGSAVCAYCGGAMGSRPV